jgi:hypothetical protein
LRQGLADSFLLWWELEKEGEDEERGEEGLGESSSGRLSARWCGNPTCEKAGGVWLVPSGKLEFRA